MTKPERFIFLYKKSLTKKSLTALTYEIIGACIEVHKALGPGLLETVYQKCLAYEFSIKSLEFDTEFIVPVTYKGFDIDTALHCDFLVEDAIVLELKSVKEIMPVHEAQLLTYMKLLQRPKGILMNFNCANLFKEGQKTYVNDLYRNLPE